jgi:hypothetical protein
VRREIDAVFKRISKTSTPDERAKLLSELRDLLIEADLLKPKL